LNDSDEVLLMRMDDPTTRPVGGQYKGAFWHLVGGRVEAEETIIDAAAREVFEETGIGRDDIEFGPLVWFGELDLVVHGIPTQLHQEFVVARTKQRALSLANLTDNEPDIVKGLEWFRLDRVAKGGETVYPGVLAIYLRDIIEGRYPDEPLEINLE
jgi:8-oxo-dGTP pyrophosphatase MutT (NUDIX family)